MFVVSLGVAVPLALPAQRDSAIDRFIAEAKAGTRRYASQEIAVADGFVRVGVEFPAMGEHWVNLGRVMEDSLVAARPSVLIYVNMNGAPRLAGVAYTDLLAPGERPAARPAPLAWHEHNGAIDEESLPLGHHDRHTMAGASSDSLRLSILHAWVWIANPSGTFVTDNWSLPAARFGITADRTLTREALHALALGADDERYYLLMLRTSLAMSAADELAAERVIALHRSSVRATAAALCGARILTSSQRDALASEWDKFWRDLQRTLPRHAAGLQTLRRQL